MVRSIGYIMILVIFYSCKNESVKKEYYDSGYIKKVIIQKEFIEEINYYDMPGEICFNHIFHKNKHDSLVYYYNNGNVFKRGLRDKNNNLFGKWDYYNRDGYLSDTKEFFIINNQWFKGSKLNQVWYYNKEKDTMYYGNEEFNVYKQKEFYNENDKSKRSIFVRFDFPVSDTILISEPLKILAEDAFPFWENKKSESYVVIAKENFNFNKDFSNENNVKLDTFYCLSKDNDNNYKFPNHNKNHTVAFGMWFNTPGKKFIRGYMEEAYQNDFQKNNDSLMSEFRRTYFEKIIYVKDTVKIKR